MTQTELFDPGENLLLNIPKRHGTPVHESVSVSFPARIHISPIDCNRFAFGRPGGGGMGFAVKTDNSLSVSVSDEDMINGTPGQRLLLAHWVILAKNVLSYEGGLSVSASISGLMHQHSGLGSSAVVATACMQAINLLFGKPLSMEEIRRLIAYNFVEACDNRLSRGLETGVGTYVLLAGGFCIIGDKIVPLFASHVLDDHPLLLVQPKIFRPDMDKPESIEMLNRSFELDASYRYIRAYRSIMDIAPCLYEGDIEGFGKVVWDFQFAGTHISMVQAYDDGGILLYKIMTELKNAGASVVGLSSVGPTIFALAKDLSALREVARSFGCNHFETEVSGKGVEMIGNSK